MAEQEACTELVEKASNEQSGGTIEGESLLLPLLQGLLEAPENEQTADSGTESGEDQRSGLIAEVQNALDKLSVSLRSDATDITPERRSSLLYLVTKLQAGLCSTTPKLERRLSSGSGRFGRRRQRQNRHTVGVSSEELANARRLMEEISLGEITPSQSESKVSLLQKQNSESSVNSSSSSFNKFNAKTPVKNATAKPFSSSNSNISNTSSSVQTPTDPVENINLLFNDEPTFYEAIPAVTREKVPNYAVTQSASVSSLDQNNKIKRRTLSEATSIDSTQEIDIKSVQEAVQEAAARKKRESESAHDTDTEGDDEEEEEEEEEETSTVTPPQEATATPPPPSPLQENPIYSHPTEDEVPKMSYEEKCNRFNTQYKKLKMKRANTIDIPKSINFYENEDTDYSETEEENQRRKSEYYALRGPIRVSDPMNKNSMPVFQPKTESDQKFLAFINKNNQNGGNSGSVWGRQTNTSVWGSKFGNIKNTFEKATSGAPANSAKNFWKTADDAVNAGSSTSYGPTISRKSARNLQQMFEEKQRKAHDQIENEQNVVTGSLTLKTEPDKNYKFIPQPLPVNKFSHAPQSAFQPIPRKVQLKPQSLDIEPQKDLLKTEVKERETDTPLFLYSPKPLFNSQNNSTLTSPVTSKPWVANATEHGGRVLSMAAKKFEAPPKQENNLIKPRKLSKEIHKVFIPQPAPQEKLTAPYLVKNAEQNNTVRKLSGQYDNVGNKSTEYTSYSNVKYQPPQEKKQYVPNYRMPPNMATSFKSHNSTPYHQSTTTQYSPTTQKQTQFSPNTPHTQPQSQFVSHVTQNYQTYNQPLTQKQTPHYNNQQLTSTEHYQNKIPQSPQIPHINQTPQSPKIQYQNQTPQSPKIQYQNQTPQSPKIQYPNHTPQSPKIQHQNQTPQSPQTHFQNQTSQFSQIQFPNQSPLSPPIHFPNQISQSPEIQKSQITPHQPHTYTQNQQYQPKNYSIRYDQQPKSPPKTNQQKTKHDQEFQPSNYSITYDKPKISTHSTPASLKSSEEVDNNYPASKQVYQHVPGKEGNVPETPEKEFTSTCQFVPQSNKTSPKQPNSIPVQKIEPVLQPPKYETQTSTDSVHEYTAISSKVMSGPVSQQAVTVRQKSPMNRNEHDMEAAFNLRNTLQKVGKSDTSPNKSPPKSPSKSPSDSFKYKSSETQSVSPNNSIKYKSSESSTVSMNSSFKYKTNETQSQPTLASDSFKYKASEPKVVIISNSRTYMPGDVDNVSPKNYTKYSPSDVPKPTISPSSFKFKNTEFPIKSSLHENKTFGVVKPIQQKPVNATPIYNNVSRRVPKPQSQQSLEINEKGQSVLTGKFHIPVINVEPNTPTPTYEKVLSKSDSWHQICMANQTTNKPSPRGSPVTRNVMKSKSSNSLAVPQKQFEAGMSKDELVQKKKTMEAYFSGKNSPTDGNKIEAKIVRRSINRIKTSEKISTQRQSGLCRSRTLPDIICPDLLDESNVDKSFDDLFKSSS